MQYKVVSADSHIIEPFDLWTKTLNKKWGEALPQVVTECQGQKGRFFFTGFEYIKMSDFDPVDTSDSSGQAASLEKQLLAKVEKTSEDPALRLQLMDMDGVSAEIVNPTYLLYTMRSPNTRLASVCSQPCTRSLICCASAWVGSANASAPACASNASAALVEASLICTGLPRYGMDSPSRHSIRGSARCSVRVCHSANFAKIQRSLPAIAVSISASVTQRGAVIVNPLPSIENPIVRRADRLSPYSRVRPPSVRRRSFAPFGVGSGRAGEAGALGASACSSAGPAKSGRSS